MGLPVIRAIVAGAMAVLGVAAAASTAFAIKPFYVELQAKYVRPDSQEDNDITLMIAFDQAACTICHPGDDKHKLTRYGGQLASRINKFDKANKQKIQDAFDEVGALRSDPYDPKSPTYHELFRQGKLPPGPVH